jgi:hypothetical protein
LREPPSFLKQKKEEIQNSIKPKKKSKRSHKMTSFFQSDQENPAIQTRFWSCKRKKLPPPKKGKEKWIAADREAFGVARKAE